MNIHKSTRLTLLDRQEIWRLYQTQRSKVAHLAKSYRVELRSFLVPVVERVINLNYSIK